MRQIKLIIAALFLISPFAANGDLITYESGILTDGSFFTVQVEVTDTTEGLYDQNGGGLIGFTISITDAVTNTIIATLTDADDQSGWNNFVHFGTGSVIDEWWILSVDLQSNTAYTLNTTGQYFVNCCEPTEEDFWENGEQTRNGTPVYGRGEFGTGVWEIHAAPEPETVPEPGTLALLGIGLAGMGLARRRKVA